VLLKGKGEVGPVLKHNAIKNREGEARGEVPRILSFGTKGIGNAVSVTNLTKVKGEGLGSSSWGLTLSYKNLCERYTFKISKMKFNRIVKLQDVNLSLCLSTRP
jgi:hypothetical protein